MGRRSSEGHLVSAVGFGLSAWVDLSVYMSSSGALSQEVQRIYISTRGAQFALSLLAFLATPAMVAVPVDEAAGAPAPAAAAQRGGGSKKAR